MNKTKLKTAIAIAHLKKNPSKTKKLAFNRTADLDIKTDWRVELDSKHPAPGNGSCTPVAAQFSPKVLGLNHVNISASPALIEKVKSFYVDIVGLTVGPRARLDHDGYWLYAGHAPILHLSARVGLTVEDKQNSYLNHVSLSCVGLMGAIAKLEATGTPYRITTVVDTGQTQLFLKDPAGIDIELTFFNESAMPL